MRKLTVKNFSVIKEAELEFGKITVLIGPQSSGKSLLCKLAYFLGPEVCQLAERNVGERLEFSTFESNVKRQFEAWFLQTGWGQSDWSICFSAGEYEAAISNEFPGIKVHFGHRFREIYEEIRQNPASTFPRAAEKFRRLSGRGVWDKVTYIPSGRASFVDIQHGYSVLANDPEPIMKLFALFYASSLHPEIPKPLVKRYLSGEVVRGTIGWLFLFADGRQLPLNQLSTGAKELLPLLSSLGMYVNQRPLTMKTIENGFGRPEYYEYDDFYIEEPETNISPHTQNELSRSLVELVNSEAFNVSLTITTHSPYILTAFNSLLEAWHAGNKPGKREQANAVIPERHWVNPDEFKAYAIHEGVLVSIFKKEGEDSESAGLIDGDYLDSVSDQLGSEFEKLLDIEYAE